MLQVEIFANHSQCLECITPVVDYVESHFKKMSTFDGLTESEIINMLSGNGGSQVDVVLYIISNRILP
jgi:UDP-glucose 4-epimerase